MFFVPLCTGTLLIYAFFAMILYFNSGSFTPRRAGRPGQLRPGGPRPLSVLIWHVPLHPGPGMLRPFHPVLFPAPLTSFPFLIPSHAFFPHPFIKISHWKAAVKTAIIKTKAQEKL